MIGGGRLAKIGAMAAILLLTAASAEPSWADPSPTITLTAEELAVVAGNPALLDLGETDPVTLRQALDRLEDISSAATKDVGAALQPDSDAASSTMSPDDRSLLHRNPALTKAFLDSPEAALDLIRIIKKAAERKGSN